MPTAGQSTVARVLWFLVLVKMETIKRRYLPRMRMYVSFEMMIQIRIGLPMRSSLMGLFIFQSHVIVIVGINGF